MGQSRRRCLALSLLAVCLILPAKHHRHHDLGGRRLSSQTFAVYSGCGLGSLATCSPVSRKERRELAAGDVAAYDALLVGRPRVTAETLAGVERLVLVARFGVGYDNVDVEALTGSDVLLTITPEGVRRPVASAVMTPRARWLQSS